MESPLQFRIAYSTSGFANHRLEDALAVMAGLGYRAVSLTLDIQHLDPFAPGLAARTSTLAARLRALDMAVVVETGARYILDPWQKHHPTLLSHSGAERREEFLALATRVACDLGADCVSLWSGRRPHDLPPGTAFDRLTAALERLIAIATHAGVDLAFEPEPGMFVETVEGFQALDARLGHPKRFGLALDIGHLLVTREGDPGTIIRQNRDRMVTVALEDMRFERHEHVPFGEGNLDLPSVIDALEAINWNRIVAVELPRNSHNAVAIAERSRDILGALGVLFLPRVLA